MKIVPVAEVEPTLAVECALSICVSNPDTAEFTVQEFVAAIITPIKLGQCFFGVDADERVVALLTWAFLNEEGVERMLRNDMLRSGDWKAGPSFWVIDCIAPFGHGKQFARAMRKFAPMGVTVNWRRTLNERLGRHERLGYFRARVTH